MPVMLVPIIAGGLGFGAGFWSGSGAGKFVKLAVIGGGCYAAYRFTKGAK